MSAVVAVDHVGDVAVVTVDNPPVNAVSRAVRQGLADAVAMTKANTAIRAVVLVCSGRTFIAGADIREFSTPPQPPALPDVIAMIETATKPWIAAIHGSALGGGLEVALACHYRVAVSSAKVGFPEVTLGLIPGAGGTVRLPRLIPAVDALGMIASGKPVTAPRALDLGMLDKIVTGDLVTSAKAFAADVLSYPMPIPLVRRAPIGPDDADALSAMADRITRKTPGQNAPEAAVQAIDNALNMPVEDALAAERGLFTALKNGPQSAALRHVFFAERQASRLPGLKGIAPRPVANVGVIGGGTMGAGISAACLLNGLCVCMIERDRNAADAGRERVNAILRDSRQRGLIDAADHDRITANFAVDTEYRALGDADLVVEAVFEDMATKQDVFAQLEQTCRADTVLASNTSYLDIAQMAAPLKDPSRVIGLHFFAPAHIMKLLEVVIPRHADPAVVATGMALGKTLNKIAVPAGVCDGFIGNRIMSAYRADCDRMLREGALPWGIDRAMRGFGFPMGIYEMQDLAGLDIAWARRKHLGLDVAGHQVANQLCDLGRFGRKTGRGWYVYRDGKPQPDPEVEHLILDDSRRHGIVRQTPDARAIVGRILSAMQTEGAAILQEGVARTADDIDVVMTNGFAFPRWRGGPMFMKD